DPGWKAEKPRVLLATDKGNVTLTLEREAAPVTVANFLNLTSQGFYDGVLFHRVVAGFVIQGGDPNTRSGAPATWGSGGPGYQIPDEFNPSLRHAGAGILSMANAGPNTGGSQFFITLAPQPTLDDRHSVFGEVSDGMAVVNAIGSARVNAQQQPQPAVRIQKAEVLDPVAYEAAHGVGVHPVVREKTTEAGRAATFAVVVENRGNVRDAPGLAARVPAGWTCSLAGLAAIPASTGHVAFLTLTPPANATDGANVTLTAASAWPGVPPATASVTVKLGRLGAQVKEGDKVTGNYAGVLTDGRLFDTSMLAVAKDPEQPLFNTTGGYHARADDQYQPFGFTVGSGVIAGFTNLAKTARVGETVTALIPVQDAYAQGNVYQRPVVGKDLVFELEIQSVG